MSKLYVMGDPHLSFGVDKPMDIFGGNWQDHAERLSENWKKTVCEDDVVLLCGDISWGLKADEAVPDLKFIDNLPGKKILMKGNHELWWESLSKLDALKRLHGLESLNFLYNDAIALEDPKVVLAGSRGWKTPFDDEFTEQDAKIWRREVMRLETSLKKAQGIASEGTEIVAFLHYPPLNIARRENQTEMQELLEKYNIKRCYFGHIHGFGHAKYDENGNLMPIFKKNGVEYYMVSADFVDFTLTPVV